MTNTAIKVTNSDYDTYKYIDFVVAGDDENIYRYEEATGKMKKLFGCGRNNFGKAIRGNIRKQVENLAKTAYENRIPFAISFC